MLTEFQKAEAFAQSWWEDFRNDYEEDDDAFSALCRSIRAAGIKISIVDTRKIYNELEKL